MVARPDEGGGARDARGSRGEYIRQSKDIKKLNLPVIDAIADLYDLGLSYPNDPEKSRDIVKGYINAILNDATRKYQLDETSVARTQLVRPPMGQRCELHS